MAFKISIIGSGNVAEYLASTFYRHQVEVVEICGRNLENASQICEEVGATYI
jgi:glutamyl-tRNA reductase